MRCLPWSKISIESWAILSRSHWSKCGLLSNGCLTMQQCILEVPFTSFVSSREIVSVLIIIAITITTTKDLKFKLYPELKFQDYFYEAKYEHFITRRWREPGKPNYHSQPWNRSKYLLRECFSILLTDIIVVFVYHQVYY